MDILGFEQGSIFDLFGGAPAPAVTEEKKPAAKKTASSSKPATKKASNTGGRKLDGPVTVVGTGWKYVYGEAGKTYTPAEVLKGVYDAGYRSIICATSAIRYKKDASAGINNILFIKDVEAMSIEGDTAAPECEVRLGMKAASFDPSNFEGKDKEEITLADVRDKFVELNPDFKGCDLAFVPGPNVAMPVFSAKRVVKLSEEKAETLKFWSDSEIKDFSKSEAVALYPEDEYEVLRSKAGVYFAMPTLKKDTEYVSIQKSFFGVETKTSEKAKEYYRLPAKIWLEQYGQNIEVGSEMFGGKEKVTKDDVINFLKPNYKAFQSKSRQFDVFYDEDQALISVYMVSGKKGAAAQVVPFPARTMDTALGRFTAIQYNGSISVLWARAIRLIPVEILSQIIDYFRRDTRVEAMVQVYYSPDEGRYYLKRPYQVVSKVSVDYKNEHTTDILVLTAHSHNTMSAVFSKTDDEDECYTGLFMVIGRLDRPVPEINIRAGLEGFFGSLNIEDVFDVETEGGLA